MSALPIVLVAMALFAGGASAASFCVGNHPLCGIPDQYPATAAGLTSAIADANNNSANPGADSVYVGAGTYTVGANTSPSLSAGLSIIGAGKGSTFIEAGANNINALFFSNSSHPLDISGITFRNVGYSGGTGLYIGKGAVHDVGFEVVAFSGSVRGFRNYDDATLDNATFKVTGAGAVAGYASDLITVTDTKVIGTAANSSGFQTGGTAARTFDRVELRNLRRGIFSDEGPTVARNVFAELPVGAAGNGAIAIESENGNNCGTCNLSIVADNVTVIGSSNSTNQVGIGTGGTSTDGSPESGVATVNNSYFHMPGSGGLAIRCTQSGAGSSASLDTSYVAADPARVVRIGACSGADTGPLDTTALGTSFNLTAAGDYRPTTGSPLIDAGDPAAVVAVGATDIDELDRLYDGDADLTDRLDIGAYEFQPDMKPAVAFTATPNPVDPASPVSFTATASDPDGGAVTLGWQFGDAASGTGFTPSHSYTNSGDYDVVATATDDEAKQGTSTAVVHVNSGPPTTPIPDVGVTEAFRGEAITFTASGSTDPDNDPFTYEWSFSNGQTATGASVQATATTVGTFTATVKAVDDNQEESAEATITVTILNRAPVATALVATPATVVRGETVGLTSTDSDADGDLRYHDWDYGDGLTDSTISSNITSHSYATIGQKTVTLTVRDAFSGEDTITTTVDVVNQAPVVGSITRAGEGSIGDVQSFAISGTDADADPLAFSWSFGDGSTGTGASVSHAYKSAGTFSVVASANDGQGAVVTAQATVTIDPPIITLTKPAKGFKLGRKIIVPVNASSATVATLTLTRVKVGWKQGKKCVAKRPSLKSKKRCDIALKGSTLKALPAGNSVISIGPRWAGKKLPKGKYRLTATPDQGGKPVSVLVAIL
ncbi:MAG: PKD domain-containing protein [Thermoleophilaceae bacterium]|nr:PKD domain-containing protein [Thermoleophilaceae bacterium]